MLVDYKSIVNEIIFCTELYKLLDNALRENESVSLVAGFDKKNLSYNHIIAQNTLELFIEKHHLEKISLHFYSDTHREILIYSP